MKAIRFHEYGDVDVLRYEDAPDPVIAPDCVLIRVVSTTVNPIDCRIRSGMLKGILPLRFPAIPGADVAGVIEEVGAAVNCYEAGDAVIARATAACAERVACRVDSVARAPVSIPLAHSAGIPVAGGAAWCALFESAEMVPGQVVLVLGGSGGVGAFAIQLAKLAGAQVIATTSTRNVDWVRSLGADEVIDYTRGGLAGRVRNVDLVLDTVGGEAQRRALAVLRRSGLLLSFAESPDEALAGQHGVSARRVERSSVTTGKLAEIAGWIDARKVTIPIEREFALTEASEAHHLVASRRARGKVILRVS